MPHCDSSTPYHAAVKQIAEQLYCPVCQGQSIASSSAPFARVVRADICEDVQKNIPQQMIIHTLEQRYGTQLHYSDVTHGELFPLHILLIIIAIVAVRYLYNMIMVHRND